MVKSSQRHRLEPLKIMIKVTAYIIPLRTINGAVVPGKGNYLSMSVLYPSPLYPT
jgi:hypothetical protein